MKLPVFKDPVTGEPSLSATLVFVLTTVVLVKWCLGGNTLFKHTFAVVTPDEIGAWLSPVYFLYFGRKATTAATDIAAARKDP